MIYVCCSFFITNSRWLSNFHFDSDEYVHSFHLIFIFLNIVFPCKKTSWLLITTLKPTKNNGRILGGGTTPKTCNWVLKSAHKHGTITRQEWNTSLNYVDRAAGFQYNSVDLFGSLRKGSASQRFTTLCCDTQVLFINYN